MQTLKTLIICKSVHHQNTAQVARSIASVLHADVVAPEDVSAEKLQGYDLVGFGSGIYFGRFHAALRHWISQLPPDASLRRRAFVFSTSGLSVLWRCWHGPLKAQLKRKGFDVVAEFHCRGFDTVGPLWLLGGLNRHHPDERDLRNAAAFARSLRNAIQQLKHLSHHEAH